MQFSLKKQKSFLAFFIIVELFVTNALPVSAGLFGGGLSLPSASSIASDLERRYNLDLGSIQNQAQSFNVADAKKLTPEVSFFFTPSDPKEGEKISAKAFPIYFTNTDESLYYTWSLKHVGCDLNNSPSAATEALCDRNGDGHITVEDWKMEAATILVQNGYDSSVASYAASSDDDGYKARFGGDNKTNTPDYCYVNDPSSGVNYELSDSGNTSFGCPAGTSPVCMVGQGNVTSGINDTVSGGNSYFDLADSNSCYVSGLPTCSAGVSACGVGSPRCVADSTTTTSCGSALSSCSTTTASSANPYCKHLFPNATGQTSGDGSFGAKEEQSWGTDPNDPSTAGNGNKDEANVVGLGRSTFTWNYVKGDKVGVAVEGTSMINTKHSDASYMIMWAFSKKDCPISLADGTGSYTQSIKGYSVNIPTADFNLNKCIERNLVDPTEGGQSTNLSVSITASPNNPVNDPGDDKSGDVVMAQATVDNAAQNLSNVSFDWVVEISNNVGFNNVGSNKVTNVTADLRALGLLGSTKGNALDAINVKMNIPQATMAGYLGAGIDTGYMRFKVTATENFSNGITRKGKSDVILKFVSTQDIISAYKVDASIPSGGDTMKVALSGINICNAPGTLDRTVCRITKNEIIGLKVNGAGLSNFNWTINGTPLLCTARVSGDCALGSGASKIDKAAQGNINYFPVTGNVGDTYTVVLTANNIATGKMVTLTRAFNVVEPKVVIESTDKTIAWQKFLGQYKDIAGLTDPATGLPTCPGGYCDDLSESIFQAYSGSTLGFQATFIPGFLSSLATKAWSVDGEEKIDSGTGINFLADKVAPGIYTVNLLAQVVQPENIRRALLDIWGVTPFESPETNFSTSVQVEIQEPLITEGPLVGPRKYYAAIASYIPASVLFTFRIFLSAILTIFALSFLHGLLEERRIKTFVENFSRKR